MTFTLRLKLSASVGPRTGKSNQVQLADVASSLQVRRERAHDLLALGMQDSYALERIWERVPSFRR